MHLGPQAEQGHLQVYHTLLLALEKECLTHVYRLYATLMFVFVIDEAESELAVLDLIQVFVEVLDRSFENVCELDLIFNPDKVSKG